MDHANAIQTARKVASFKYRRIRRARLGVAAPPLIRLACCHLQSYGAWAIWFRRSNRRGKKPNGKREKHETAECINSDVYWISHRIDPTPSGVAVASRSDTACTARDKPS